MSSQKNSPGEIVAIVAHAIRRFLVNPTYGHVCWTKGYHWAHGLKLCKEIYIIDSSFTIDKIPRGRAMLSKFGRDMDDFTVTKCERWVNNRVCPVKIVLLPSNQMNLWYTLGHWTKNGKKQKAARTLATQSLPKLTDFFGSGVRWGGWRQGRSR